MGLFIQVFTGVLGGIAGKVLVAVLSIKVIFVGYEWFRRYHHSGSLRDTFFFQDERKQYFELRRKAYEQGRDYKALGSWRDWRKAGASGTYRSERIRASRRRRRY
jgi:hypothetical protein